jgi:hypothetical protein
MTAPSAVGMDEANAEVERILAMSDEEVLAELAAEGFTEQDAEIFHWKALATAALKAIPLLHEKADKFMWKVRDTCVRAEKAEAELTAARAERDEARELWSDLNEATGNHQKGPVVALLDRAEAAERERDEARESAAWWRAETGKSEAALSAAEAALAGAYEECAMIAETELEPALPEHNPANVTAKVIATAIRQRAGNRG